MMMDENTRKLPVVQTTDGSIGSRCVVLLFSYFFLYITIISDYGIVFALMSDIRNLAAHEEWIVLKLDVMMISLLLIVGCYFILALCRKISWGEFFSAFGCCFFIMLQLVLMNVSPID